MELLSLGERLLHCLVAGEPEEVRMRSGMDQQHMDSLLKNRPFSVEMKKKQKRKKQEKEHWSQAPTVGTAVHKGFLQNNTAVDHSSLSMLWRTRNQSEK